MQRTPGILFSLILLASASFADAQDKPNVILLMCDAVGWGDVGFDGGTRIRTPHLDEMAANGLNLARSPAPAKNSMTRMRIPIN